MDDLAGRQLAAIAEVLAIADGLDTAVWLRGGWAVDFTVGRVTRAHLDVDWFAWHHDLPSLVAELVERGWAELDEHPHEQQRDLRRGGVDLGFAPLARTADAAVVVGGGPWAGTPWPAGMVEDALSGRLGRLRCPVISPAAQIEIKTMMPVWMPGRPRRQKDAADIALLVGP